MAYLHGHKPPILHRYLRPSKLLVDADWNVKVRGASQQASSFAGG